MSFQKYNTEIAKFKPQYETYHYFLILIIYLVQQRKMKMQTKQTGDQIL